jgi:hypothetical protein
LVASSDRLACHSTNHIPRPILSGTSVDPRAVWEDGVHRCPSPTLFSDKLRLMPPSLMPPNRDGFVCVSPWPFDDPIFSNGADLPEPSLRSPLLWAGPEQTARGSMTEETATRVKSSSVVSSPQVDRSKSRHMKIIVSNSGRGASPNYSTVTTSSWLRNSCRPNEDSRQQLSTTIRRHACPPEQQRPRPLEQQRRWWSPAASRHCCEYVRR